MTAALPAKIAPIRNAALYPLVKADASELPASSRLDVREAATLARTARPSAPPIMNDVLTIPEARPDSCGSTSLIAASSTGLKAMPAPRPSSTMLGKMSTR